jgi:hypothetical protein
MHLGDFMAASSNVTWSFFIAFEFVSLSVNDSDYIYRPDLFSRTNYCSIPPFNQLRLKSPVL